MVLGVEGDRPGLHRPSSPPAPRMLLREGQHVGQVFSTMDGDKCSLDPCFGTQGVRGRHGCDVVMFNMVPGSSTGTECLPIIHRTRRFEVCSCRNSLASLARPLPRPTRRQNVAGNLVRSPLPSPLHPASTPQTPPTLLGSAHRTPDHAPPVQKAARATATVTPPAEASADASTMTPDLLQLPLPDSRVSLAPAVGLVSLGLPVPTLRVSLSLPWSALAAPDPAPVQSPADDIAAQDYPSPPGSRTSTPPPPLRVAHDRH